MNAKELLTHPITAGSGVIAALGSIGFLPFDIWGLVNATSGFWFPLFATLGATLLPEFGYAELGTRILVGAAIVFVVVQLNRLIDRSLEYFENR